MKRKIPLLALLLTLFILNSPGQEYRETGKIRTHIVKNPFMASESIIEEGLVDRLLENDCEVLKHESFSLSEEESEYTGWTRSALVSRHIRNLIAENRTNELFIVGLLGNCEDLYGMLAGLQNMKPEKEAYHLTGDAPNRVGLIYFDAHADINIPETTLSGMFGGMDVAMAAGLFNENNRLIAGLDPPLPPNSIILADIRDTDPLEVELINRYNIESLSTDDIRNISDHLKEQIERLSDITDLIYIHVDMDVLAPEEVEGHGLTAPDGPTSIELANCIRFLSTYPKVTAIGIASTPFGRRDPEHLSRQAAIRLIEGAVQGVAQRE